MRGTWYVLPTPFHEEGSVDQDSLRRLVGAAISWEVDGLTAMGVMSEASALAPGERETALATILETVDGRVPVAVGCSAPTSRRALALAGRAKEAGAAAAMVSAPPLARNLDALPGFFAEVATAGLPLVVQDEPATTGVAIPVSVLLSCLRASGARAVKLEDPPTAPKIGALLAADPELDVFGGLGGVAALSELRRGACGTMTGFAFPEILRAVREAWEASDAAAAAEIFDRYLPLLQFEGQPVVGLGIRKEILRRRGVIESAATREPVPTIDAVASEELDEVLARVGIVPSPDPLRVSGRSE